MLSSNGRQLTLALALFCGAAALAQGPPRGAYLGEQRMIETRYREANAACATLAGNAVDICEATATGIERIAAAELEARFSPSIRTRYEVRLAQAEATYAIAQEHCDDIVGDRRARCIMEADAVQLAERSAADARMMIAAADALVASEREARYDSAGERCGIRADAVAHACQVRAATSPGAP